MLQFRFVMLECKMAPICFDDEQVQSADDNIATSLGFLNQLLPK
jgi:hypothetical protein